tara:strand:- start:451 stop:681 length:231 start_codon:yes stop_codon:yes gene_type:complete
MKLSINDRCFRLANTTHVVRIDDMSVYRINDIKLMDGDIFVETDTDLWFQDLDVFTLEEAADAEKSINWVKKIIQK